MPRSAAPASTYVGTSEGRIVTIPACSNSSLRSLERTSAVSNPRRSSRSSVSANRLPRGTAIRSSDMAATALLTGEGDVQALHAQGEPHGGQGPPELGQELVVAASAPDGNPQRRVIDLEHGAGVVAQAAHQPQVEDDP